MQNLQLHCVHHFLHPFQAISSPDPHHIKHFDWQGLSERLHNKLNALQRLAVPTWQPWNGLQNLNFFRPDSNAWHQALALSTFALPS